MLGKHRAWLSQNDGAKQIPERQGEVWLLRGWKSLKFGAENPQSLELYIYRKPAGF